MAMAACGRQSLWREALQLLRGMPLAALEPNVFSYSAAMSACEKACHWQRALLLLGA